jgi:hypothetical protein
METAACHKDKDKDKAIARIASQIECRFSTCFKIKASAIALEKE